ncbi:unnamed protein product [Trypanosoma congolense IL3000]|uniref:WGS project CAEQ00000000 data, annotated contig 1309 n=1 Tax=Trypanosoma congolense (strain IL3000) TaxID=1068625 RepID=F9W5C5_TRYCI|nr:unnamed protein product [Trypanosoma congolense IL3000]
MKQGGTSYAPLPLVVDLCEEITPQSLRHARWYADLIAAPPPAPHPFGVVVEGATSTNPACAPAQNAKNGAPSKLSSFPCIATAANKRERDRETPQERQASSTKEATVTTSVEEEEDASALTVLGRLREHCGYSVGTAMYRVWVRYPQSYLSWMSGRIADAVVRRVMPLIERTQGCGVQGDQGSVTGGQYDIHVRYFLSSELSHHDYSHAFCAEIIVRDVDQLKRIDEAASLVRAQYTAVRAENQTLESSLAFWRSISFKGSEVDGGAAQRWAGVAGCSQAAMRPPRDLSAVEGCGAWEQPTASHPFRGVIAKTNKSSLNSLHERDVGPELHAHRTAGIVAVLYLSFGGVVYAGAKLGSTGERRSPVPPTADGAEKEKMATLVKHTQALDAAAADDSATGDASQCSEPVFFLPCSSNSSFVRGLLGL